MATKTEICIEEEINEEMATMEDTLCNFQDGLQLCILTSLDRKHELQTSLLSKTRVSNPMWTRIPVPKSNNSAFNKPGPDFDDFVNKVLCLQDQPATLPLERLGLRRNGICSQECLQKVFDYAFTHPVEELKVQIDHCRGRIWPVCVDASSEFLTSLNLQSMRHIKCPFLGPRSGSFKNLSDLYLKGPIITDLEPFSGFPELQSLILLDCVIRTEDKTLRINAPKIESLIISCYRSFKCCELTTPNLKIFGYEGCEFPRIQTHEASPVLDTLSIGFHGGYKDMNEKRKFDDLLDMFSAFRNAKFVPLFSPIIALLSLFEDELGKRRSPFKNLEHLMLNFRGCTGWLTECSKIASKLEAYFLQNSPDAKFTMIYPDVYDLY